MIAAALGVFGLTRLTPAAPVSSVSGTSDLAALEDAVAAAPADAERANELALRYLEVGQPGLAVGVLNRAPRHPVALMDTRARALAALGYVEPALTLQRRVLVECQLSGCSRRLEVSAMRRELWLSELDADGVADGPLDPSRARAAYRRVTRQVRLASR